MGVSDRELDDSISGFGWILKNDESRKKLPLSYK